MLTRAGRNRSQALDAARVAAQIRRSLYPWQRAVVDVGLERTARGRWRYPICTVCVPRQAGKTTLMAVLCLHRCLSTPGGQVWYTAQSRMDGVLRWREMVGLLRRSHLRELTGQPRIAPADGWDFRVRGATGGEVVEFANGAQLRVFSPAEDSLHGSVTDLVVLDEARFFDAARGRALMAAVLPTQATRDGQVWIVSTAGDARSTFLADEVEAGRLAVGSPRARRFHAEWGLPDSVDGDLLEAVWRTHPAAGLAGGPRRDALAVAADSMPSWQFAQEYGNRWHQVEDMRLLPGWAWDRSRVFDPLPDDAAVSFGVDVAIDRTSAAVVACADGVTELVEEAPRADWVAARVLELVERWSPRTVAVDAAGPAGNVAEQLAPVLGDTLATTSLRQLSAACSGFYDALLADPPGVWHRPSQTLDDAAAGAVRRTVGQSWVFSRVESGPGLLAMVLAWWAATQPVETEVEEAAIWV